MQDVLARPLPETVLPRLEGTWSSGEPAHAFAVENPATGEVIATVRGGGAAEIDAAVRRAHEAFEQDWRWRHPRERGALLHRCAQVVRDHADELAKLETLEMGKPWDRPRTSATRSSTSTTRRTCSRSWSPRTATSRT